MDLTKKTRVSSIDLLKGMVMVIMALDHTRDYFHASAFLFDPTDPTQTSPAIFFTRWITHFCAPIFSFLAGASAFIAGRRKTKSELSGFLLKRGLWLIFIELTIVNFAWYFDIYFRSPTLVVIWALGWSMIVLAAMVHLPKNAILIISLLIIIGHNALDGIHIKGSVLWAILHDGGLFPFNGYNIYFGYPLIPWIAVMPLGYYFGSYYNPEYDSYKRQTIFNRIGLTSIALFFVVRYSNIYGNPSPWKDYPGLIKDTFSFMDPNKYPPSLLYLLMTLGAAFLFLANSENLKGKIVNFFSTFGRVPFFYYILHIYLIHLAALVTAEICGFGWKSMLLSDWVSFVPALKGFGFPLWVVYVVWIGIIVLAYPLCKKFDDYKKNNRHKWWLSYL